MKLWEGNVFTVACHSVDRRWRCRVRSLPGLGPMSLPGRGGGLGYQGWGMISREVGYGDRLSKWVYTLPTTLTPNGGHLDGQYASYWNAVLL